MGQFLYKKRKVILGFISCWVDRIPCLEREVRGGGAYLFQTMMVRVGPYLVWEKKVTVGLFLC